MKFLIALCAIALLSSSSYADLVLDSFDNDRSHTNGEGTDTWWNPPGDPTFVPSIETNKVFEGSGALKVEWEDKGLFPSFSISNLNQNGNNGALFDEADAVRVRIAGDGGRIIMKLSDSNGVRTGDLSDVTTSGSDEYEVYEFPYFETVLQNYPNFDLTQTAEMSLLIDAGELGSSGTIYIDSIELILGSGDTAEVVGVLDNFDNDTSMEDDPNEADSLPSSFSKIAERFAPYSFSVVNGPADPNNAVLQIDYDTSPWNVIFISELDVTDWSAAHSVSIDVYGTVNDLLMKLQFDDLTESNDLPPVLQDHQGNQWDTLTWTFDNVSQDRLASIRSLLFFVEGPNGGEGTIFVDNLTLLGELTGNKDWEIY